MGAGKNKAHRKKRISKHILKKKEEHQSNADQEETTAPQPTTTSAAHDDTASPTTKKQKKNRHVKDPSEAASYLSAWKYRNSGGSVWKFNKNTQSWLIRHMYQAEQVNKTTFALLLDYLATGNEGMRARVRQDATKRALRYKEYEKNEKSVESSKKDKETKTVDNDGGDDENARWNGLNDHDKRKEYKRARKVLDALKE